MNIAVKPLTIHRPVADAPVFVATGRDTISIRARTEFHENGKFRVGFGRDFPIAIDPALLVPGSDLDIVLTPHDKLAVVPARSAVLDTLVGGFHFAAGGNAEATAGGDAVPAINPCSIWDVGFRPACLDPRGMALVEHNGLRFWCDIYLLGVDHRDQGASRFGAEIADGRSLPQAIEGKGRTKKLDYETARAIYAHHGKQLLGAEEFFAAAYGVTERTAAGNDPKVTGLDVARTSRFGIMQATGNLWIWGTDGHPDDARPSIFGGSWISGVLAGSRFALLGDWPVSSLDDISARGRSDHAA